MSTTFDWGRDREPLTGGKRPTAAIERAVAAVELRSDTLARYEREQRRPESASEAERALRTLRAVFTAESAEAMRMLRATGLPAPWSNT